jgi:hypothetical protein
MLPGLPEAFLSVTRHIHHTAGVAIRRGQRPLKALGVLNNQEAHRGKETRVVSPGGDTVRKITAI